MSIFSYSLHQYLNALSLSIPFKKKMLPAHFTPLLPVSEANAGASLHPPLTVQLWNSAALDTRMSYSHRYVLCLFEISNLANSIFKSVSEKLKTLWRTNWPNLPMTVQSSSIIPLTPFCKPHQQPWVRYHSSTILTSGFRVMPFCHDVSLLSSTADLFFR